jgi:homoserine/homoserine lactone efflux protein
MIETELLIGFALATFILVLIPGPIVTMVIAKSIAHGPSKGLLAVAGSSSAILCQLVLVTLGMSSIIALLAQWFEWLRWAGVIYLIYLGLRQFRAPLTTLSDAERLVPSHRSLFLQAFLISATTPKSLLFFGAFFPQFIDPLAPAVPQLLVLSVLFFTIATLSDGSYALLAGHLGRLLRGERAARWRNRVSGVLLIAAGLGLALARRQA